MTKQSVLEKVKKALTLAEGAGSAGEAEAAMLAAQRLMAKHNLSMSDVQGLASPQKEVEDVIVEGSQRVQWWEKALAQILAENFRCYTYLKRHGSVWRITFLGLKEDVQIACEVFSFARNALKYYSDRYVKMIGSGGNAAKTRAIKNDYILGFLSGLKQKLREQVEREQWGLVLVKDDAVVQAYEEMNLGKGKASKVTASGDMTARAQGYVDGSSLDHQRQQKLLADEGSGY